MATFRIVLVDAKSQGNVGAVARVMKNFGQTDLVLVNPPAMGEEAKGRALHAQDVLEGAPIVATLAEALRGCDYVVGTSARIPDGDKTYLRNPVDVADLPAMLRDSAGTVALLFGREDFGLYNSELEECDLLVTIPTSPLYRSLNLSHAVGVVLYELFRNLSPTTIKQPTQMSEEMRRHFQTTMDRLIDAMNLPEHQARNTKTSYRKLFGRAVPSAWEYFVMMGILRRCLEKFGIHLPDESTLPDFDIPAGLEEDFLRMLGPHD